MLLYIVRHGMACEANDPDYSDDTQRPLTKEGRKRFRETIRALVKQDFRPMVVGASPLVRCQQTAEILVAEAPGHPKLVELLALAPGSQLEELIVWTNEQQADEVAWVGHAPDVGELLAALIGRGEVRVRFAKGAVAAVEFEDQVGPGGGELRWLVTAKLLGV